jgi:hypothetical protein
MEHSSRRGQRQTGRAGGLVPRVDRVVVYRDRRLLTMLGRTREELARLLDETPAKWRPLFDLHVAPFKPSQSVSLTVSPTLQI